MLLIYFSNNIKLFNEGSVSLILLLSTSLIGICILFIEYRVNHLIMIRKSFFILVLFCAYLVTKIIIDIGELYTLKVFTISTTGGIILFYSLGTIISSCFVICKYEIMKSEKYLHIYNSLFLVFLVLFLIVFFDMYSYFIINLKNDLFILSDIGIQHQRPGTFLIISFMILTFLFNTFIVMNIQSNNKKYIFIIGYIVYFLSILSGMFLSQMIGSNISFVSLSGMLFLTITFLIYIFLFNIDKLIINEQIKLSNILFCKSTFNFVIALSITIILIIILLTFIIILLDLDLSRLRILGFGTGEISSINSRIELWKNFIIHFSFNPILGNMNIENLTTGEGTYVHSFIGSLLTHLGIVGFLLFFIYLYYAIKELIYNKEEFIINKLLLLFTLLLFIGIFLIATFGVFMSWIPLWFLLGLVFPAFKISKGYK
jgi:hypothetical protein